MKVQAKLNLGTRDYPEFPLSEGEIGDVPDDLAHKMIARGHAVIAAVPKEPEIQAVPPANEAKPKTKGQK